MGRTPRRDTLLLVLLGVHVALAVWAVQAWIAGPFHGAAILDGGEVLALAQHGRGTPFDTKSPLYPWLLGLLLRAGTNVPWMVGLFGLAASLAILLGIRALCRRLGAGGAHGADSEPGADRAAGWAMALYVVSGSPLLMLTQPLPALLATALLLWGTVAALMPAEGRRAGTRGTAVAAGALLGAAVLALASLLPAALVVPCAGAARGRRLAMFGGALLVGAVGLLLFGARVWPEGSGLNLRLGNGGQRSGTSDVRPGPAYDRLRLEAVFAAYDAGAPRIDADAFQRRALGREIAADPAGAAATLLRKLFLFWHRTEIVTDADFRHGLRALAVLPALLLAWGLIAPLALVELLRRRSPLRLPVAGVLLANVLYLTSARYRFPALPFLCVAAGMFLASRPRPAAWVGALLLAVLLNVNLSGRALIQPGDGSAQEGRELLAQPGRELEALAPLAQAAAEGRDPRVRYDLALAYEKLAEALNRPDLGPQAEAQYREALALDPLYPQAAENLLRLLIYAGRMGEVMALGARVVAENPYAGLARLNLAAARTRTERDADVRALLIEGHRIASLAALAQNDLAGARAHVLELQRMAAPDARLTTLVESAGG